MKTKRKHVLFVALVALLVCFAAWRLASRFDSRAVTRDGGPEASTSASALEVSPQMQDSSERLEARTAQTAALEEGTAKAKAEDVELSGRVTDAHDRPIEGADIDVRIDAMSSFDLLDPKAWEDARSIARVTTDAEGRFAFQVEPGRPHALLVHANGFAEAIETDVFAGQFVHVQVERASALLGLVRRASDDAPIADVEVLVHEQHGGILKTTRTDAGGNYVVEGLRSGSLLVQFVPQKEARENVDVELAAGERKVLDVHLHSGVTVAGVVRDASTGRAIEGAEVSSWNFLHETNRTDAFGHYAFVVRGHRTSEVSARAKGFGALDKRVRVEEGETATLDFDLKPSRSVHGRILQEGGGTVAGAYVGAIAVAHVDGSLQQDHLSTRSADDGRFEIENLRSDLSHALFVCKQRFGTVVYDFPSNESRQTRLDFGDVYLRAAARLSGTIVTSDGKGIEGVYAVLEGWNRDRFALSKSTQPVVVGSIDRRTVVTDANGGFHFADLAAGSYTLKFFRDGLPPIEAVHVDLAQGETRNDVRVVVDSGLSISGHVVDADGQAVVDILVVIVGQAVDHDPRTSVRSEQGGLFHFEGLKPGRYSLWVMFWAGGKSGARPDLGWMHTTSASAGTRDLLVQLPRLSMLEGVVLDAQGEAVAHPSVRASNAQGQSVAFADAHGLFRLSSPEGASVDLEARRTKPSEQSVSGYAIDEGQSDAAHLADVRAGSLGVVLRFEKQN